MNNTSAYIEKLEADIEEIKTYHADLMIKLRVWHTLLSCSGIDSKGIVKKEIMKVIKENE